MRSNADHAHYKIALRLTASHTVKMLNFIYFMGTMFAYVCDFIVSLGVSTCMWILRMKCNDRQIMLISISLDCNDPNCIVKDLYYT